MAGKKGVRQKSREAILQGALITWVKLQYPKEIIFHIPNGGFRTISEGARFKRMGVAPGIPDLMLARPNGGYGGLFIEMKAQDGRLSDNQRKMIAALKNVGYRVEVVSSLEHGMKLINEYLDA
jgi:hypothetical protein